MRIIISILFASSVFADAGTNFYAFGDSKTAAEISGQGYWGVFVTNYTSTGKYAGGGWTSATILNGLNAGDLNGVSTYCPYSLVDVGVNDISTSWSSNTLYANFSGIINYLTNKWVGSKVGLARPWLRGDTADRIILDDVVNRVVTNYANCAFKGPDESVWLEGGDDGATWTVDGTHYTEPAGIIKAGNKWQDVLDSLNQTTHGTNVYVDSSASGANNGTSWTDAWNSITNITGLLPGDTVYISGGPSGSTRTYYPYGGAGNAYHMWKPESGSAGNPITYRIGQDTNHNGTAWFDGTDTSTYWLTAGSAPKLHDVVISGDAGDGLLHFVLTNYSSIAYFDTATNVTVSHVRAEQLTGGIDGGGIGIRLHHLYAVVTNMDCDHFSSFTTSGNSWGSNSVHDCTIYVPALNSGSYSGADVFQWSGNSYDLYNNNLIAYFGNYTFTQHPDGWQGQGGSYIRIYNNLWANFNNYAIYGDLTYSSFFTNLWVFNNVTINCGAGIAIGPSNLAANPSYWDGILVFNNTVDGGDTSRETISFGTPVGDYAAYYYHTFVNNNIVIGGAGYNFNGWTNGFSTNANVWLTTAQATNSFSRYAANLTNSYFMPLAGASAIVGQGTNLNSFATLDILGTDRGATWDIGAYEYVPTVLNSIGTLNVMGNAVFGP